MHDPYAIEEDEDGMWAVFNVEIGMPVCVDGIPMMRMTMADADRVADRLNAMERLASRCDTTDTVH